MPKEKKNNEKPNRENQIEYFGSVWPIGQTTRSTTIQCERYSTIDSESSKPYGNQRTRPFSVALYVIMEHAFETYETLQLCFEKSSHIKTMGNLNYKERDYFRQRHYISTKYIYQQSGHEETDQNSLNSSDFEVKIRFLKNKLNTENLIQVLDSTKDLNSSIKIFKWASNKKRFYHTADTYFWVILKLGMVGNVKDMEFFCNEMIKGKCPHVEEAFASLIDSFAKNHRLDEALKVLEIMNLGKIKPSIRLCNVLLRTLIEEKRDLQSILFAYKEIVKAGIIPNVETLNYLIEILCENDKMESALDQYRRMNKKGCCPEPLRYLYAVFVRITSGFVDG
ncbi:hypothetical protein AQUCO_03800137v1 [Aquilegia coerulea]|uniref:Pentatricopeptide repeat-containing protein-mitochondrial domain-containing protein n=1 Tax=Aquilegia coerulea TaxID=218851 RepID=A0A2G5CSV9_AQUCA|nr:hypothetical protein AQUCO_03800137v1 [Aquilegia coerulea]